jgi:predicted amidohydrolase
MAIVVERPEIVVHDLAGAGTVPLAGAIPWVCREAIAPRVWREAEAGDPAGLESLWLESNGSEGCYGGWELRFAVSGPAGSAFAFHIAADAVGLARGADALVVEAFWYTAAGKQVDWDPILLAEAGGGATDPTLSGSGAALGGGPGRVRFAARLRCPDGAAELRVRAGIRWSPIGRVRWHGWRLHPAAPVPSRHLRLGVASAKPERWVDMATNAAHYVEQCRRAGEAGIGLVCLPELIFTIGMPQKGPDDAHAAALPIPGPWLEPFQDVARRYRMGICFSTYERAGAAGEVVYNTAVLLGPDGGLAGTYRKVHLALAEARNGIAAGHEFPVFDLHGAVRSRPIGGEPPGAGLDAGLDAGRHSASASSGSAVDEPGTESTARVGMLICMDSSPLESTRVLARKGAEIMLMPIAGDFRASAWVPRDQRRGEFDEDRWQLIQRAHAFDNHLFTAVARNNTVGSNVTAPWGEILAYDDGTRGLIWADVDLDDRRRHPTGSTMQAVIWSMRRPHVYEALADPVLPAGLQVGEL